MTGPSIKMELASAKRQEQVYRTVLSALKEEGVEDPIAFASRAINNVEARKEIARAFIEAQVKMEKLDDRTFLGQVCGSMSQTDLCKWLDEFSYRPALPVETLYAAGNNSLIDVTQTETISPKDSFIVFKGNKSNVIGRNSYVHSIADFGTYGIWQTTSDTLSVREALEIIHTIDTGWEVIMLETDQDQYLSNFSRYFGFLTPILIKKDEGSDTYLYYSHLVVKPEGKKYSEICFRYDPQEVIDLEKQDFNLPKVTLIPVFKKAK